MKRKFALFLPIWSIGVIAMGIGGLSCKADPEWIWDYPKPVAETYEKLAGDIAIEKEVWIHPPALYLPEQGINNKDAFFQMLSNPKQWEEVRSRTDVFSTFIGIFEDYGNDPRTFFPDDEALKLFFGQLKSLGLKLAIEYWPFDRELGIFTADKSWDEVWGATFMRIKNNGGELYAITMDSPFWNTFLEGKGNYTNGPTYAELMAELHKIEEQLRTLFPGVKIGTTESYVGERYPESGGYYIDKNGDRRPIRKDIILNLYDTFKERYGDYYCDYWMNDSTFDPEVEWMSAEEQVVFANEVRSRGIKYAIMHPGAFEGVTNNEIFYNKTLSQADSLFKAGLVEDIYMLESFMKYPTVFVPETERYTFANLARDFLRIMSLPRPMIKANGRSGSVTINSSVAPTITVEMNAAEYLGAEVDWWVVARAGALGWFYLNGSRQWTPFSGELAQLQPVYQGPLFDLTATPVLSGDRLPVGTNDFWFGVDYPMNGVLDLGGTVVYDKVTVISTTAPASSLFIYHGVATHSWSSLITPDGNRTENLQAEVNAYEAAVGRAVSFIEFAHEWKTDGSAFPITVATTIKNRGATPFIFLNLRSADVAEEPDPIYNLAAIISGEFDTDFAAWADAAKIFGTEIIVSWGWEMNGAWSAWSGPYNGGPVEGPKRFREAYRHIVELMRNRGADNIRWAFHINFPEYPDESWNAFENYYPGDDVIDLVGASIYGAGSPTDVSFPSFESLFDPAYSRLVKMTPQKPVFVFEFGAAANHPLGSSATWADDALSGILSGRWPTVRGFAWWNDYWSQDDNSAHDTEMRVEAVPGLAAVFMSRLSEADNVGDRPPIF